MVQCQEQYHQFYDKAKKSFGYGEKILLVVWREEESLATEKIIGVDTISPNFLSFSVEIKCYVGFVNRVNTNPVRLVPFD